MSIVVVAESGARLLIAVLLALLVAASAESEAPPATSSTGILAVPFITFLFLFVSTAAVTISVALGLAAVCVAVAALQLPVRLFRELCAANINIIMDMARRCRGALHLVCRFLCGGTIRDVCRSVGRGGTCVASAESRLRFIIPTELQLAG